MDANFSLFALVQTTLGNRIALESVQTMLKLSRIIEDEIISLKLDADIYVGFQKIACYEGLEARYQQIAQTARQLHFFGLNHLSIALPDRVNFIPLSQTSRLRYEWFILVNHPRYTMALIGREILVHDWASAERRFFLLMASQPEMVASLETALLAAMANDPPLD